MLGILAFQASYEDEGPPPLCLTPGQRMPVPVPAVPACEEAERPAQGREAETQPEAVCQCHEATSGPTGQPACCAESTRAAARTKYHTCIQIQTAGGTPPLGPVAQRRAQAAAATSGASAPPARTQPQQPQLQRTRALTRPSRTAARAGCSAARPSRRARAPAAPTTRVPSVARGRRAGPSPPAAAGSCTRP